MIRGFLVSIGFLASSVTFASSLICSGESLYLRSVSNDFGTRPQPGAVLGRETILMNGDVLQDYTRIEGLRPNGIPPYGTVFEDNAIVLENSGSHIASKSIFKRVMVLNEYDSRSMNLIREVAREEVVCKQTSYLVP